MILIYYLINEIFEETKGSVDFIAAFGKNLKEMLSFTCEYKKKQLYFF